LLAKEAEKAKRLAEKSSAVKKMRSLDLNAYIETPSSFESMLGAKDVYSIRIAGEISALIQELRKLPIYSKLSNGELIEHVLFKAFKMGLLCNPTEQAKISDVLNDLRAAKAKVF